MLQTLFKPKLLYRRRLKAVFEEALCKPLTIVIAAIGYGKTTATKHFLQDKNDTIQIWFELLQNEMDNNLLWLELCNALSKYNLNLGNELKKCGFPSNYSDLANLVNLIYNSVNKRVVFILDGFNYNKNKILGTLIEMVACRNIPNLNIIITSREFTVINYKNLENRGICSIISLEDLVFTYEEGNDLFSLNGFIINNSEKENLFKYTEGWAAGLYLALISYSQTNNLNNLERHNNLIEVSFFNKLDNKVKISIMKLSVVDEFTIEQALFITKDKKSVYIIQLISERRYFIKNIGGVYKLHILLKLFAYEKLMESNINLNFIYNLYGNWYLKNLDIVLVMDYYFRAKNYKYILNTIECYPEELVNIDLVFISNIFKTIPEDIRLKYPLSHIIFAYLCVINLDLDYSKDLLNKIKILFKDIINTSNTQLLAEMNIVEALINFDNLSENIGYLKKAYNLLRGNNSRLPYKDIIFTLGIPCSIYIYYKEPGNLKSTIKILETDFCHYCTAMINDDLGYNYLIRAEYLFEIGDFYKAELFIHKAMFKANLKNQFNIVINALYMLMWISIINEKLEDFQDYNNTLINFSSKVKGQILINDIELSLGYMYSCINKLDKVPKWISEYNLSKCTIFIKNIGCIYIIYGRLLCSKGLFSKLEVYAESLSESKKLNNFAFTDIYMNIFTSIANYNLYDIETAKLYLLKAISLSKKDNIIMPFVENFMSIIPLLSEFEDEYTQSILSICRKVKTSVDNLNIIEHKAILTKRETEIMNLVAKGYKNIEIGEMLNIMPVTVEKILSNVYKKLNARNRASAVSKLKNL